MTIHRCRALVALSALAVLALAGCTPSVAESAPRDPFAEPITPHALVSSGDEDGAQSATIDAPSPRTGHSAVRAALVGGALLPDEVREAFSSETGFSLDVEEVESVEALAALEGLDVVVGLDATDASAAASAGAISSQAPMDTTGVEGTGLPDVPAAIAYGEDDVCVLMDASWASANSMTPPTSLGDLAKPEYASLLALPDPASTSVGRAFVQAAAVERGADFAEWSKGVRGNAVIAATLDEAVAAWTGAAYIDGGSAGENPLLVAPRSVAGRALTNTGTESAGGAVASTCVTRTLYAAGVAGEGGELSDGAESLIAWLQGWSAQRGLARTGAAYPLDGAAAADTAASWFLSPMEGQILLQDASVAAARAAVEQWSTAAESEG